MVDVPRVVFRDYVVRPSVPSLGFWWGDDATVDGRTGDGVLCGWLGLLRSVGRPDGQFRRSPFSSPAASVPMDDLSFLKISRRNL